MNKTLNKIKRGVIPPSVKKEGKNSENPGL